MDVNKYTNNPVIMCFYFKKRGWKCEPETTFVLDGWKIALSVGK